MSSRNALFKRALILGLTIPGLAFAGSPGKSSPMRLGTAAIPPLGYLLFCHQRPDECAETPAEAPAAVNIQDTLATAALPSSSPAQPAPLPASWTAGSPLRVNLRLDWPSQPVTIQLQPWSAETAPAAPAPAAPARIDVSAAMAGVQDLRASGVVKASGRTRLVGDTLELTRANWKQISAVNEQINRSMAQRSDLEIYGVAEKWSLPLEDGLKAGDCEDFALEKRHALIAAGFSRSALNLAVAITPQGIAHTVLIVSTDRGDYVLDSLTPWILPWSKTGYQWRQRQIAGSSTRWAMVDDPNARTPRLLLASLR